VAELFKGDLMRKIIGGITKTSLFIIFLLNGNTFSQVLNRIIITPDISPYIHEWTEESRMVSVKIDNLGNREIPQAKLILTVTGMEKGNVAEVRSQVFRIPASGNIVLYGKQLFDPSTLVLDESVKSKVAASSRIPDDNYTLCVDVIDLDQDGKEIATNCSPFFVRAVNPPILLQPADNDTINIKYPLFQWTPVQSVNKLELTYRLRVCKKRDYQTPQQSLESCAEQTFVKLDMTTPNVMMPTSAIQLEDGQTYVWQVEIYDKYGNPLGENYGKTEVFQFTYKSLELMNPER
jgi:hypothetical protein